MITSFYKLTFAWIACAAFALGQGSQLPKYTVATLPAASTLPTYMVQVIDGANSTDCATGGGAQIVACVNVAGVWQALGSVSPNFTGNVNVGTGAPSITLDGSTGNGTFSGAIAAGAMNGQINAQQQQSPAGTGNNGIQMSMQQCLSQTYACSILAPALYAQVEAQPWGAGNALDQGTPQTVGPADTDPMGCVMDQRWGAPQTICHQGSPSDTSGRFNGSSPIFSQNITKSGTGLFSHYPKALSLEETVFTGTHDLGGTCGGSGLCGDEQGTTVLSSVLTTHSSSLPYNWQSDLNAWSPSDNIPFVINARTVGQMLRQHEGQEIRIGMAEQGTVTQATLTSDSCGVTCTMKWAQTAGVVGGYGAGLPLIDLTQGYNAGYIASISQVVTGPLFPTQITGDSTNNWDSTFGTSTYTTTTADVSNTSCPGCSTNPGGATGYNTFPQSNVVIPVVSTTGFSVGQVACEFDTLDPQWECNHITAVGSGTLTVDLMSFPLRATSTIAAGGLTGYGFGMDADWVNGASMNGIGGFGDNPVSGIIRVIYPIVYSAPGNVVEIANWTYSEFGHAIQTRGYISMRGSGGSCSATVTSGSITAVTATGGTGYISTTTPPQLVLSGITSTTAPVIYVSGISGGALTAASIANAGAAISGTPTCTVVNSNPYHIYPQALVLDAYDHATNSLDGAGISTAPTAGTFNGGDLIEQVHYPVELRNGIRSNYATYQPGGRNIGFNQGTGGVFEDRDSEASFLNSTSPTVYAGYPAGATPYLQGQGQINTPHGLRLRGPHRNGLYMDTPPYGGANGGSLTAGLFIGCGAANTPAACVAWNAAFPVLEVQNSNSIYGYPAEDGMFYNPTTHTWSLTSGATGFAGAAPACTFTFSPTGVTTTGPCATSANVALPSVSLTNGTGGWVDLGTWTINHNNPQQGQLELTLLDTIANNAGSNSPSRMVIDANVAVNATPALAGVTAVCSMGVCDVGAVKFVYTGTGSVGAWDVYIQQPSHTNPTGEGVMTITADPSDTWTVNQASAPDPGTGAGIYVANLYTTSTYNNGIIPTSVASSKYYGNVNLSPVANPTGYGRAFALGTGGSCPTGVTRYYNVQFYAPNGGSTLPATETSAVTTGTGNGAVLVAIGPRNIIIPDGATQWQIGESSTSGGELLLGSPMSTSQASYIDQCTLTPSGAMATSNTTQGAVLVNGVASGVTGPASGDLSGSYPNPTVKGLNGVLLSSLGSGILKNTTGTGIPTIAVAGTDYVAPAAAVNPSTPPWLQYLGTGAEGANNNASGTLAGVHNYTNFTLPFGNTVNVISQTGLTIHATGTCTIAGTINANGATTGVQTGINGLASTGGGSGGGAAAGTAGNGCYLTFVQVSAGGTAGAIGSVGGNGGTCGSKNIYLSSGFGMDGQGLGGSGKQGGSSGGAGGGPGNNVTLICASITGTDGTHTGSIDASGQAGGNAAANSTGAGSGGGGGAVVLSSQATVATWPTINTSGGAGGTCGAFTSCGAGGSGGAGFSYELQGW